MQMEETIARRAGELSFEKIDADLLRVLKRNLMDSYAGICGSLRDRAMLKTFDRLISLPAQGSELGVWGTGRTGSLYDAIFANAVLARRSDLLNTYLSPNGMGGVHPSDNVALALTLADWRNMSGKAFLATVYTAFYFAAAFATYYDPETGGYDHDAAATFFTSLAVGRALGLSEEQLVRAQRIAGMFGLDINQAGVGRMTDWKHCTYASCALRGFQAARMALAGFQAPFEIYEGAAGVDKFFPHAEAVFDPPPDLSRIIFKRWPALVFNQTPIDVALDLAPKIGDAGAVRSIHVKTYQLAYTSAATEESYHPSSRAGRTHSMPYCIATALLKPVQYEDFDEPRASDAQLKALMSTIEIVVDPEFEKAFPGLSKCAMEATLGDGSTVRAERDCPKGDPADPLSDREIEAKLAEYFISEEAGELETITGRLWKLEEQDDVDWLVAPLRRRLI